MPLYRITHLGASHYERVNGELIRYNADPRKGRNYIEMSAERAASPKFAHLGLSRSPEAVVEERVGQLQNATPDAKTEPRVSQENAEVAGSEAPQEGAKNVEESQAFVLPQNWKAMNKARKVGLIRRAGGGNAQSWNLDQIDAWLTEYEEPNGSE